MNKFFLIVLLAFVMTGCQSYKKVPYLQDAEAVSHGVQNEQLYDAKNRLLNRKIYMMQR